MQKTGWTIHSFFLVLSGLKKSFTLDMITRGQSTTIFLCIGPFSAWWQTNDRTNNRVILVQACPWPVWEGSLLQFIFKHYRANFSMRAHFNWILIPPRRGGSLNWKHAVLPEKKTFYHMLYGDDNFSTEIEIVTFFMVWLKATLGFSKC